MLSLQLVSNNTYFVLRKFDIYIWIENVEQKKSDS